MSEKDRSGAPSQAQFNQPSNKHRTHHRYGEVPINNWKSLRGFSRSDSENLHKDFSIEKWKSLRGCWLFQILRFSSRKSLRESKNSYGGFLVQSLLLNRVFSGTRTISTMGIISSSREPAARVPRRPAVRPLNSSKPRTAPRSKSDGAGN